MEWTISNGKLKYKPTGQVFEDEDLLSFSVDDNGELVISVENTPPPKDIIKDYFDGDEFRYNIWKKKMISSPMNDFRDPKQQLDIIASEFERIEKKYPNPLNKKQILGLIDRFYKVVPAGSMLYGLSHKEAYTSLSNCFVIDGASDSYSGIFKADQEQVQLMKRRGGVGHDVSNLRGKGEPINNSAVKSAGIVPFMERFSNSTREVAQDGRRGALMLSIKDTHNDIKDFINCKVGDDQSKIDHANISVKVSDSTMIPFIQQSQSPINDHITPFPNLINEGVITSIAKAMEKSAEPGILFWDKIIRYSVADLYADKGFGTTCTNPCGEVPLSPYDSCRLMSMVLPAYIDKPFTDKAEFKYEEFISDTRKAQRLLDDAIDLEIEKIDEIIKKIQSDKEKSSEKNVELNLWRKIKHRAKTGRRTGLGYMGLADALAMMGLRYGSKESIALTAEINKEMAIASYKESIILAKERGAFDVWDKKREENHIFLEQVFEHVFDEEGMEEMYNEYGRRNIANLSIAPTGTISLYAGVTSGIEPLFYPKHKRRTRKRGSDGWEEFVIIHPIFQAWYNMTHPKGKPLADMSDKEFEEIYRESPYKDSCAHDVNPIDKVKLVGKAQEFVDHSISVTHNLPKGTTAKDIEQMIIKAYKAGCKGFTVYVDGSRNSILSKVEDKEKKNLTKLKNDAVKRPKELKAHFHKTSINKVKYGVVIGLLDDDPYEVFSLVLDDKLEEIIKEAGNNKLIIRKVKSGHYALHSIDDKGEVHNLCSNISKKAGAESELVCRFISGMLRHGMDITHVYEQVNKTDLSISHFAKSISRAFKKYLNDNKLNRKRDGITCPECGNTGTLYFKEGCVQCQECGYSEC